MSLATCLLSCHESNGRLVCKISCAHQNFWILDNLQNFISSKIGHHMVTCYWLAKMNGQKDQYFKPKDTTNLFILNFEYWHIILTCARKAKYYYGLSRDPPILLLNAPIFLSSNSFKFHLLCLKFCSLKNIHLPEVYIKRPYYLIKHIINLYCVRKNHLYNKPSSEVLIVGLIYSN